MELRDLQHCSIPRCTATNRDCRSRSASGTTLSCSDRLVSRVGAALPISVRAVHSPPVLVVPVPARLEEVRVPADRHGEVDR